MARDMQVPNLGARFQIVREGDKTFRVSDGGERVLVARQIDGTYAVLLQEIRL